jgi:uncharacterized membrane protein HdeD (DUF308 family)
VLVGVGVFLALVGLVAMAFPLLSGLTVSVVVGSAVALGGLGQVASAFSASGSRSAAGQLLLVLVYAGTGILMLVNPILALTTLALLLVGWFLLEGIVLMGLGFGNRGETYWGLTVASGPFSLLVALLVWLGLPSSAA